jgi:hypothetical protein
MELHVELAKMVVILSAAKNPCICLRSCLCWYFRPTTKTIIISTEAADSLTVRFVVERPPISHLPRTNPNDSF